MHGSASRDAFKKLPKQLDSSIPNVEGFYVATDYEKGASEYNPPPGLEDPPILEDPPVLKTPFGEKFESTIRRPGSYNMT